MVIWRAAAFAKQAHEGAFRKGTDIPYITHPLEAAVIAASITDDQEVIAAALLHDVVEDTAVGIDEIERQFGSRVAAFVQAESEDKTKSWKERKQATLTHLDTASREAKIIILGDKLSNLRSTARDYLLLGEEIWKRFNETRKEMHQWYYEGIARGLAELSGYPEYQEYQRLCQLVFHQTILADRPR